MMIRTLRTLLATTPLILLALFPAAPRTATATASTTIGPRAYYLALGDSLAFGFQPNLQFYKGYADDFAANLKPLGMTNYVNMGCGGETSVTFIKGGCPYGLLQKYHYKGPQFTAALSFIRKHIGQVSPVTLDIGANDVLHLIDGGNCTVSASYTQTLATVDSNVKTILSGLKAALYGTGDLFMMNYYFPQQNLCPNLVPYAELLNTHLASDARAYGVPIARVFAAYGGADTPNPKICTYTWMCSRFQDIHATTKGYAVIAYAFEALAGY